jgi:hypothetical protein
MFQKLCAKSVSLRIVCVPTSSPCSDDALGELGNGRFCWSRAIRGAWVSVATCMLKRCGVGCRRCRGVVLGPCGGGANVRRKAARAIGYWCLGVWVVSRGAAQGDLAGLQEGESA